MISAASTHTSGNSGFDVVLVALLVVVAVVTVMRRRQRRTQLGLERGHRVVALQQQWIDPILVLVLAVGVLRRELTDPLHLSLAAGGLVVGAIAGLFRGRLIFVEARRDISRIVIKRGVAEIAILVAVLLLTLLSRQFEHDRHSPLNLLATVVLTMGIAESFARVGYLTQRYLRAPAVPSGDGSAPSGDHGLARRS